MTFSTGGRRSAEEEGKRGRERERWGEMERWGEGKRGRGGEGDGEVGQERERR